jgi:hypothetical protein
VEDFGRHPRRLHRRVAVGTEIDRAANGNCLAQFGLNREIDLDKAQDLVDGACGQGDTLGDRAREEILRDSPLTGGGVAERIPAPLARSSPYPMRVPVHRADRRLLAFRFRASRDGLQQAPTASRRLLAEPLGE